MGDEERRDTEGSNSVSGSSDRDRTEPIAPIGEPDETSEFTPDFEADETATAEPETRAAGLDETRVTEPDETAAAGLDETRAAGLDETSEFTPDFEADETPAARADETSVMGADETAVVGRDETAVMGPSGKATPGPDKTSVMPREAAWSGRAGVRPPSGPSLRDSVPYTGSTSYADERESAGQQRPWWTPILLGVVALGLIGVLILVAWWMSRETPAPVPSPSPPPSALPATTPAEPTTQPPTTAAASPAPQVVQVPRLVGLTQDEAVTQLDRLGLGYRFEYRQANAPEGTVVQAQPIEGTTVPVRTTITLVISTGQDRSPEPSPSASPSPN